MSGSTPLQLAPEDKLDLLRYLDEFHYWHSLDDERRCKRCHRIITGRQILIMKIPETRANLRLQCPTGGCLSTPSEWVYADPVFAAKLRADFRPAASQAGWNARAAERAFEPHASPASFRAVAARSKLWRSIASGLHAIRPVA